MELFQRLRTKHVALLVLLVLLVSTAMLLAPADLCGAEEQGVEDWRHIDMRSQSLSIELPSDWRTILKERYREGESFLSVQDVNNDGQLLTANLNIRYVSRENGPDYPLPDPDAFANVLIAGMRTNQNIENLELVDASTVERSGLAGTLVEYTFKLHGHEVRGRSLNLIASDPPRKYIVSYGSVEGRWEQDIELLDRIIDSIEID